MNGFNNRFGTAEKESDKSEENIQIESQISKRMKNTQKSKICMG